VTLTREGEALLPLAREILALLEAAQLRLSAPEEGGDVRFGSPEDFATAFLPGVLARFVESHRRCGFPPPAS
jgi:DNA-binding transcriptional LysR family regulator